jgi:glycerol-3-phosphate dehydrogenase
MEQAHYDLLIIGGGINGAGIARDAAGRGQKVLLVEMNDLASATSSASSGYIHGGLRYLEYYEFGLVRKALMEREVLMNAAPHIIHPLTFVIPHESYLRPAWMIHAGLFGYDHLAPRKKLEASRRVDLSDHPFGTGLKNRDRSGFSYADCIVSDARLVVLTAMDAAERGADILTRTKCTELKVEDGRWVATLEDTHNHQIRTINAAKTVNAAGPWVQKFLDQTGLSDRETPHVRLVKGSHILVPKSYEGDHAYTIQQPDKRIVFASPYERDFTMIGTTDEEFSGDPADVKISAKEIEYLCTAANRNFAKTIAPQDVVWSWSGVRPLLDDGSGNASAVTRDYRLDYDERHGAPLLSVFGGKITTYRKLAEQAVTQLVGGIPWTHLKPLPGGDLPNADFPRFVKKQKLIYSDFPPDLVERYAGTYGTRMDKILQGAKSVDDLGQDFGGGLYAAEVHYLMKHEMAQTPEDVLWRRTKRGLFAGADAAKKLETLMFPTARTIKHENPTNGL